jgi:fucose permease
MNQSRRLLFFTLFLAYIGAGVISILPGPTLLILAQHTNVPLDIAGWSFTASSIGFALGVLCAGFFSGKIAPKYLLMAGLAIMATFGTVIPLTHLFPLLIASQFIMGIGFGFIDVSINIIVALSFADTLGQTLNNLHSAFGIGALGGPLVLSLTLQMTHDATGAYLLGAIAGMVAIFLLVRQHAPGATARVHPTQHHHPRPYPGTGQKESQPQPGRPVEHRFIEHVVAPTQVQPASSVFKQLLLWLFAIQFFLYLAAEVGFNSWIVTAISQTASITLALAAPAATAFWSGLTIGRLIGAQLLKRGILTEHKLLYCSFIGGGMSGLLVAIFPDHLWLSFSASALVGFFFGPIWPGAMAIVSRRFVHALGTVSGVVLVSAGISGMVVPVLMGFLIPSIGVNWVMAIPALACLLICIPFSLALWRQRHTLHLQGDAHTIKPETPLSSTI